MVYLRYRVHRMTIPNMYSCSYACKEKREAFLSERVPTISFKCITNAGIGII